MGTAWAIILSIFALTPVAAPFLGLHWLGEKLMEFVGSSVGYLMAMISLLFD